MTNVRRIDQIAPAKPVSSSDQIAVWQDGRTRVAQVVDVVSAAVTAAVQAALTTALNPGNPVGDAIASKLAAAGGTYQQPFDYKSPYFTVNARSLFTSDASTAANWLGDGAGGSASQFAYGGTAEIVALSGIGDVGVVGATRTDLTVGNRLPIGTMGWAFNFKTTGPKTAWAGYFEARRKKGAGQIHGLEINVTDLGDGSDRIIPSAKGSGQNAVYGAWSSALNIAAGGNVKPGQQTGWDGEKEVTQASAAGVAIAIYANGAKFEKGIIIGENALVGAEGLGGATTATGLEMGRGTGIAWTDGSTRQGSRIDSDISPSGNGIRQAFTDFGWTIDGYGSATLNVIAKSTDINGIQILGGTATQPARVLAAGSASASLSLECAGGGAVFIPNLKNAASDSAAATAGVPLGALYRNGSVLMIRVA